MKRIFLLVVFLMMAAQADRAGFAVELAPDELVRKTADEVLAIVKNDKDIQSGNRQKVVALAEAKVLPHFDFKRMTMWATGKFWRKASPQQQDALIKEFRTLLVNTYSSALALYKDQPLEVKAARMQPDDAEVTVNTVVRKKPGAPPIPIDYSMEKTPDGWKVYDVVVDGVSLLITYRSDFAAQIRQSGIDGLIDFLTEKNKALGFDDGKRTAAKA
jgi:phospholipid transport system substrate-binding protein